MKNKFIVLVIAAIAFFGCKKDDDKSPTPPSKTTLLTQQSWKFDNAKAGAADVSASVSACLKDNVFAFASNSNLTVSEETNVCSPSYAGNYTWAFQTNETILHLSGSIFPGGSGDFTVVSLTETNLVVSQQMTIAPFPPTTVQVTFKH
jgi:hypothetical protein